MTNSTQSISITNHLGPTEATLHFIRQYAYAWTACKRMKM